MKKPFVKERKELIERSKSSEIKVFSDETVGHLPEPVKKYLSVCGYMNTPVPINADIYWSESYIKMSPKGKWSKLRTSQFNSVNPIGRTAFMKFSSMPLSGRDIYVDGKFEMKAKLFNLFTVVFANSQESAQSALITSFCEFFLVPGYLLSDSVEWESLTEHSVRATLSDHGVTVSGVFYFDENGFCTHFETDDRYYSTGKNTYKKLKFSAVYDGYKSQGSIKIAEKAKVIWHLPEGDYEYFKGVIDKIEFNVEQ
jgi:hypothetical protein